MRKVLGVGRVEPVAPLLAFSRVRVVDDGSDAELARVPSAMSTSSLGAVAR